GRSLRGGAFCLCGHDRLRGSDDFGRSLEAPMAAGMDGYSARSPRVNRGVAKSPQRSPRDTRNREQYEAGRGWGQHGTFNAALSLVGDSAPIRHTFGLGGRRMRERSLIVNDNPVERRLLDQNVRGFGYEPALALLDNSGHVRALADIEA